MKILIGNKMNNESEKIPFILDKEEHRICEEWYKQKDQEFINKNFGDLFELLNVLGQINNERNDTN